MGFIMVYGLNDGHFTPCKMTLQSYMHIDGLVQDCSNSSANALELLQSCVKLSI